ncbi:ectoderm-neural cortex protein 1-like [Gigantopelta aegis]|uniref:ectoderm-neural cortex protein 1-like n=1 Tax=Gigantopelta aegis TaxID=1735272 RepID=UPI001B888C92|nr:ectoderm-neural cortex protein 1-like [Gigantopelta aegis]XP_041361809.1 ectoderm-neural cortex protein 1-like [Gigantopelta aegis]
MLLYHEGFEHVYPRFGHRMPVVDNDVKLVFQDDCMTGSRLCLTALSSYFESMLTSDMLEKNTRVVALPTVSKETFDDVLKFHFLGADVVNSVNCFLLLDIAEMMQLDELNSRCRIYMKNSLTFTTKNCIHVWSSLKKYGMEDVAKKAFRYIVRNLEGLSKNGSIADLTKDEYLHLLSQDDLSQKEEDVLRDLQKWITENNSPVETMVDLFAKIRFELVSYDYLIDNVAFTSIVKEHEDLQQVVQKGLKSHHYHLEEWNSFQDNRFSVQMVDVIFVLGKSRVLSVACLTDQRWCKLPSSPFGSPGDWFSGAVLGKSIYITGGSVATTSTAAYNVIRKTWIRGPHLKHHRFGHSMAVLDDTLYVFGGEHSSTIEQLQLGQLEWQVVGDLECKLTGPCAEAVGENILMIGGISGGCKTYPVVCFNTKTRAVCKINIDLHSNKVAGSYLELPNLYLLHSDKVLEVIHVDDINKPTLRVEHVARFGKIYDIFWQKSGIVHRGDYIIVISEYGIEKLHIKDGSREHITFGNAPALFTLFGTVNIRIPRFCLQ